MSPIAVNISFEVIVLNFIGEQILMHKILKTMKSFIALITFD